MKTNSKISRRAALKGTLLGVAGVSVPFMSEAAFTSVDKVALNSPHYGYPAITRELVSEVVGKSHSDLDRVKELVDARPELARAAWDWGFGDVECALGAASHVGRRDIVQYLLSKGARPNLFTYTMLGAHEAVKQMIEFAPGIQRTMGPHGISLLQHAKAGLRMEKEMTASQVVNCKDLISYLESLGDADGAQYEDINEEEKPKYLGDYKYGTADEQGFSVRLNMRKLLSLGKIGSFGGALYKIGDNKFFYNGAPSTQISFKFEGEKVVSLTVKEPGSEVVATKIS